MLPAFPCRHAIPAHSERLGLALACSAFCGVLLPYLVFGVLFMRFRKDASGSDMIPNKGFWVDLPGLVADGFRFVFGKITGRGSTYQKL